jgi:hypothetical protein
MAGSTAMVVAASEEFVCSRREPGGLRPVQKPFDKRTSKREKLAASGETGGLLTFVLAEGTHAPPFEIGRRRAKNRG